MRGGGGHPPLSPHARDGRSAANPAPTAFFRRFDTDGSGFIDVEEFVQGVAPVEEDTYECMDALGTHRPRLLPGAAF